MPGQTQISNLLGLKSNSAHTSAASDKQRSQSSLATGDAFKRMLNSPVRQDPQTSLRPGSERSASGPKVESRTDSQALPEAQLRPSSQAEPKALPSAELKSLPSAELKALSPAELKSLSPAELKSLSPGELKALSDQVESILGDLRAQLEAGELGAEAEAALKELLLALEEGAPVDEIAQLLAALPIGVLPEGASRFPEASNLGELLGGSGAAYLRQLATEVGAHQRALNLSLKGGGPEATLQGADLDTLLAQGKDLSSMANKENFVKMLQAVAGQEGANPRAANLGEHNTSASSLASLDANARTQPLQPSERPFTVQSEVRVPVNQGQWGQAVGQRVLWLAAQNVSSAELRLDPPDLGPLQVRVSSHQDQISVTFTSAQPAVREALDQNATRLREMFAEQGLDLADVNVSDQSSGEQAAGDEASQGRGGSGSGHGDGDATESVASERLLATNLVDYYV